MTIAGILHVLYAVVRAAFERPLLTLLALLLLAGFVSAQAETFGRTTEGATASGALRNDFKRGSKFTLAEDGTVTSLCAWLDGAANDESAQAVRYAMYRDVNGTPDGPGGFVNKDGELLGGDDTLSAYATFTTH